MTKAWHGGKGSAPRKGSDQNAYSSNWDNIFGKKKEENFDEERTLGNIHEHGFVINNNDDSTQAE